MLYKFTGKPDKIFPKLVTGKTYNLAIQERSRGLLGFLVGNTYPIITYPILCPYDSWESFNRNWERVSL